MMMIEACILKVEVVVVDESGLVVVCVVEVVC